MKATIRQWRFWLAVIAIVTFATAYFLIDPEEVNWMPRCLFRTLTGWECPGCGSQRMIHALLHGQLVEAWHYNPFFVASSPIIIFLIWLELRRTRHPRLYAAIYRPAHILIAVAIIIAWGIIRNLHL